MTDGAGTASTDSANAARTEARLQSVDDAAHADQLHGALISLSTLFEHYKGADPRVDAMLARSARLQVQLEAIWKRRDGLDRTASDAEIASSAEDAKITGDAGRLRDDMMAVLGELQRERRAMLDQTG